MDKEIEIFKVYADNRSIKNGALWEVSNLGRVRKNGEEYIPSENKKGYLAFGVHCYVHRAVAELFVPNPHNKPTVDHINRQKFDNRASNLRWATPKEQAANRDNDAIGNAVRASKKGKKLSEETRRKMGAAHLGNKNTLGYKHSKEAKAKMSAALLGNKRTLGKVYVFNPTTEHLTCVNPSEIPDYLAKGYIRGRNSGSAIGKVWVINPTTEHSARVNPSQLNDYLTKGYVRGRKIKK